MDKGTDYEDYIYTYVILFHGNYDYNSIYEPVLSVDRSSIPSDFLSSMHLLDKNLVPALPVVEYVMHLPRVVFDLHDLDEGMISASYDTPHSIILLPDSLFRLLYPLGRKQITGVFCTDDCDAGVLEFLRKSEIRLGIHTAAELNDSLLDNQWEVLRSYEEKKNEKTLEVKPHQVLQEDQLKFLPQAFLARQFHKWHVVLNILQESHDIERTSSIIYFKQIVHLNYLLRLREQNDILTLTSEEHDNIYEHIQNTQYFNVVLTYPGIPQPQIRFGHRLDHLPAEEQKAIRILGVHRAIAENALFIELPCVDKRLYEKLNELESFCQNKINGRKVWRTLREIGKLFDTQLTPFQKRVINRAERISAFTDFPFGLAVLGGGENPLSCYKRISYHSITPLSRTLEMELQKQPQISLRKRCRVAFVQCIPDNNKNRLIRRMSDLAYKKMESFSFESRNFHIEYKEALDVQTFKDYIKGLQDFDILYISAHGFYMREINAAGLVIGKESWMGNDNDLHVPPVVILSACHTAPRGSGVVNVADLFLRMGAVAVLEACIPIDAKRNTLLMTRLFTYIIEAQKGSLQYRTLAEAWMGVTTTNALHEIAQASPGIRDWLHGKNKNGVPRIIDFQLNRCGTRLLAHKTYSVTIEIIKEMLHEEGMDGKFDNVLSQQDFFPESLFYQLLGNPENIFLYNELLDVELI